MPSVRPVTLAAALLIAAIAGCNSASAPSTAPAATSTPAVASPAATASPPPAATPDATPAPTAPEPTSGPPGSAGAGGDLADMLPDEVGGIELEKESVSGDRLDELDAGDSAVFTAILQALGAEPEALSAASAEGDGISLVAIRVEGEEVEEVGDAFIAALMSLVGGTGEVTDATVAGREVKQVEVPGISAVFNVALVDDIVFVVSGADEALIEQGFEALP